MRQKERIIMKNIHLHDRNQVDCKNSVHHIELSETGVVVARCGWSKFPSVDSWTGYGGTVEQRTALESACNAVYQHLTTAIISSAIYGASEEEAKKTECNNSEREAIVALRNLVAMLGTKIDRAGKARKNMFVIDATSIKCIYVLCAGRKPMELCAPEVFNKKIVPFLLFCATGEELSKAANMTAGEAKRQQERREEARKKVAPEELEKAQEANKKLTVEKETVMTDNRLLKEKLDKVRRYVEENETLSRELLLEMLKD